MLDLSQLQISFLAGTLGQGGAERQLYYLLRALKLSGTRLRLFCLTRGEFWEQPLRDLGVPVIWIGQHPSRLRRLAQLIVELRRNHSGHQSLIIQSQHFFTNIYAAAAARTLRVREIGAMRNDGLSEIRSVGRVMGTLSLRLPHFIAANSQAAIRQAIGIGVPAAKLHLLRNVVDTDHFTPSPCDKNQEARIIAIGRLVAQKRFDRLLTILARVRAQSHQPIKAVIAGDGPLRLQLEKQTVELGLGEMVEFRGEVSDSREIYREADILALTSDWEGTPNVVLEAMACGLPVMATSVGDLPELIRGGMTGFLARPEEEEKMVAALLELLHNPCLRKELGRRGREHVVAEHSQQQLPHRLQNLYKALLA